MGLISKVASTIKKKAVNSGIKKPGGLGSTIGKAASGVAKSAVAKPTPKTVMTPERAAMKTQVKANNPGMNKSQVFNRINSNLAKKTPIKIK